MNPSLEPARVRRGASLLAAGRFTLELSLAASAWVFACALAVAVFAGQVTWDRGDIVQKELLGFAYAFVVAGTITGVAALVTSGEWPRAIGFGVIGGVILASSAPALRWLIFRLTAPNLAWARREWREVIERLGPSLALGAAVALVVSALVLAAGLLARRIAPWQFGIVVAVAIAILGLWAFPVAISHATDRAIPYLRWHYGHRQDEALRGAAVGAGPGALAGAIVAGLTARWLGASKRLGHRSASP